MLKTLQISNLGLKGLSTDLAPQELPPEYITSGINFHVHGNKVKSTTASEVWSTAPVDFNAGHVRYVIGQVDPYWLVPGRSAVYAFDGGTWFDVTSTAAYAGIGVDDELLWTSCMLGAIPIINNPQHVPEYWSPQRNFRPSDKSSSSQSSSTWTIRRESWP